MTPQTQRVDHIVFRWTPQSLLGDAGLGPTATSLTREQLIWWSKTLEMRITRAGAGNDASSLAYLRYGTNAVIVHKVPAHDDKGRPGAAIAHALIAPAGVIDVELALGLDGWPDWADAEHLSGLLPPFSSAPLRQFARATNERLRSSDVGDELGQVLACAMDNPAQPFTVVGPGVPATTLVRAVVDVFGTTPEDEWTFATNEHTDTAQGLPKLVFLDSVAGNTGFASSRRRLLLGNEGFRPGPFATSLTTLWRERGPDGLAEVRGNRRLVTAADISRWRQDVFVSGVLLTGDLLEAVTHGAATEGQLRLLDTADGHTHVERELKRLAESQTRLARVLAGWHPGSVLADRYPDITVLVHVCAVRRCLDRADAAAVLIEAVRAADLGADMIDAQVANWAATARTRNVPLQILEIAERAFGLGLPVDHRLPGLQALLSRLSLADLIVHAHGYALTDTALAELLLTEAQARRYDPAQRADARAALENTDYLLRSVPELFRDIHDAVNQWRGLLAAAYGHDLADDRHGMRQLLDFVGQHTELDVPPAFAFAVRGFATTAEGQALADQMLAREGYLHAGLPDIWDDRQRLPSAQPAPVPKWEPAGALQSRVYAGTEPAPVLAPTQAPAPAYPSVPAQHPPLAHAEQPRPVQHALAAAGGPAQRDPASGAPPQLRPFPGGVYRTRSKKPRSAARTKRAARLRGWLQSLMWWWQRPGAPLHEDRPAEDDTHGDGRPKRPRQPKPRQAGIHPVLLVAIIVAALGFILAISWGFAALVGPTADDQQPDTPVVTTTRN